MTSGSPSLVFGTQAARYHRGRPPVTGVAVDWLTDGVSGTVVDIGAGTGSLTAQLITRMQAVIAVEPSRGMRAELTKNCPTIQVRPGAAERLPLPARSVNAAFMSGAWHWVDVPRAVQELARVLVPGGRLGVCWNNPLSVPQEPGVQLFPPDVMAQLASARHPERAPGLFVLPRPNPFSPPERFECQQMVDMTPEQIGELLNTYSGMLRLQLESPERCAELTRVAVEYASMRARRLDVRAVPVRFMVTCYRTTLKC